MCVHFRFQPNMFVVDAPFVIRHYNKLPECADGEDDSDVWNDHDNILPEFADDEDDSNVDNDHENEEDAAWLECQKRENSCKIASQQDAENAKDDETNKDDTIDDSTQVSENKT